MNSRHKNEQMFEDKTHQTTTSLNSTLKPLPVLYDFAFLKHP